MGGREVLNAVKAASNVLEKVLGIVPLLALVLLSAWRVLEGLPR